MRAGFGARKPAGDAGIPADAAARPALTRCFAACASTTATGSSPSKSCSAARIDGASVHPREVVKQALARNAAAVILAHNHPSGLAEPSQADELITRRLKEALALVDIRVMDHLVVGDGVCESFAERGLL